MNVDLFLVLTQKCIQFYLKKKTFFILFIDSIYKLYDTIL